MLGSVTGRQVLLKYSIFDWKVSLSHRKQVFRNDLFVFSAVHHPLNENQARATFLQCNCPQTFFGKVLRRLLYMLLPNWLTLGSANNSTPVPVDFEVGFVRTYYSPPVTYGPILLFPCPRQAFLLHCVGQQLFFQRFAGSPSLLKQPTAHSRRVHVHPSSGPISSQILTGLSRVCHAVSEQHFVVIRR